MVWFLLGRYSPVTRDSCAEERLGYSAEKSKVSKRKNRARHVALDRSEDLETNQSHDSEDGF
jgi:hypothetical protein